MGVGGRTGWTWLGTGMATGGAASRTGLVGRAQAETTSTANQGSIRRVRKAKTLVNIRRSNATI
jgi:hypothetical protein